MSFFKTLVSGVLEGVSTMIEENHKYKEAEEERKLIETKERFDKVVTDKIKDQQAFQEATNIVVFYAGNMDYRRTETIEKMEAFVKKHTEVQQPEQEVVTA